ncbi:MAG: tetratricopeptide repeat protein [Planctomycetes bacterium]|nr:tetratricopeptide repeat protein [Planctomycetota bacterium]
MTRLIRVFGWIPVLLLVPHAATAEWKLSAWEYRKSVVIVPESKKSPLKCALQGGLAADFKLAVDKEQPETGMDAALLHLAVDGHCNADGSDIRILEQGSREVPYEIVHANPKTELLLLFRVENPDLKFAVYYGNPQARRPLYNWQCQRGLFLETRPCPPGTPASWEAMQAMVAKATATYGVQYNMWIFNHYNPLGGVERYLTIYRGWLRCPETGTYAIGTTSDGPSFVLLDGQLVVQKLGGPANREVFHTKELALKQGLHRIEYYAGGQDGTYRAVAAWKPPSAKEMDVIRHEYFPKVLSAETVSVERRGSSFALDFEARMEDSIPLGDSEAVSYSFNNKTSAKSKSSKICYEWDFGDGTTSTEDSPVHVFFQVRENPVKLVARGPSGQVEEIVRNVRIEDYNTVDHERQHVIDALQTGAVHLEHHHSKAFLEVPPEEVERVGRRFVEIVSKYSTKGVTPNTLLGMIRLFGRMKAAEGLVSAGEAFLERFPNVMASAVAEVCLTLGDAYGEDAGDPGASRRLFERLLQLGKDAPEEAQKVACLRLGSLYLAEGNVEKARQMYEKAEGLQAQRVRWQAEQLKIGGYEISVMGALNEGKYVAAREILDEWEKEFPKDVLRGRSLFLRGKSLHLEKNYRRAAEELKRSLTAAASASWLPEAYELLGRSQLELKEYADAAKTLRRLLELYPRSSFAGEAPKLLKKAEKNVK